MLTKTNMKEIGKTMISTDKVFSLSKIKMYILDLSKMENMTVSVITNTLTEKVIKVNGKKKNGTDKVSITMLKEKSTNKVNGKPINSKPKLM